jgi:DNA-binding CsgD family transcriptional regulator
VAAAALDERIARALPELYALRPIEHFPSHALSLVLQVVGGNKAVYTEVDQRSGDFRVLVDPEPPELKQLAAARRTYTHEHPVLTHYLASGSRGSRLISDFITRREFHRLGLYGEFFALLGVEDQITLCLTEQASAVGVAISIDRDRVSFDEHDRRVMDGLRPHLAVARANAIRFSRALTLLHPTDHGDASAVCERLTEREREILAHVSLGRTNAQIALALDISAGTVRKHIEHILRRLDVPTRTAAAVYHLTGHRPSQPFPWTASIPSLLPGR